LPVEKKLEKNNLNIFFENKVLNFFLTFTTRRPPLSVHKKIQPNRSSRLAGYRQHIYMNVLFLYRFKASDDKLDFFFKCWPPEDFKSQN